MSVTISKEIDIELDYEEVKEAVEGLGNYDKKQLVSDCDLGEDIKSEIADDLANFIDENCSGLELDEAADIIRAVVENSRRPTSDIINLFISGLDEDVKDELNVDASANGNGEITQTQMEFLKIVGGYMDESKMKAVVEKHKGGSEMLEFFLTFIGR
jgi:hypothetical protein